MMDQLIDQLIEERKQAESIGNRQSEADSLLLLALLLADAKLNPSRYVR